MPHACSGSGMASVELAVLNGEGASILLLEAAGAIASEERKQFAELLLAVNEFCKEDNVSHVGCKPHKASTPGINTGAQKPFTVANCNTGPSGMPICEQTLQSQATL